MISLVIVWCICSFLLYTFGYILLSFYNKVCDQDEAYNFFDTIIIGLCLFSIFVSITSFILPCNQYVLYFCLALCVSYWSLSFKKIKTIKLRLKDINKRLPFIAKIGIILFVFICISLNMLQSDVFDSFYYHIQNIRWNEEHRIIPGLANIEDRFGFNSNILLVSAPLTFRSFFNEAIYPLSSLFLIYLIIWSFVALVKSDYELKMIFIFISSILLFIINIYSQTNTSTDILGNILVFYLIVKFSLNQNNLTINKLLYAIVPVFLITCKLSTIPYFLISIYIFYYLFKIKNYKTFFFVATVSSLIMLLWIVRNVIISGYLIYPLYQIDLFSFDWKVPIEVAKQQSEFITFVGKQYLYSIIDTPLIFNPNPSPIRFLVLCIYIVTLGVAIAIVLSKRILKTIKSNSGLLILISSIIISVFLWAFTGPDHRFIIGSLLGFIVLFLVLLTSEVNFRTIKFNLVVGISFCVICSLVSIQRIIKWNRIIDESDYVEKRPFNSIIFRPYPYRDIKEATTYKQKLEMNLFEYKLSDDFIIYASYNMCPYDMKYTIMGFQNSKFVSLKCLEMRGREIEDGFRLKKGCDNTIHPEFEELEKVHF